jgi:hypothetical protein
MLIDIYHTLVRENVTWPGKIGDSAAESARYEDLKMLLGDYKFELNLKAFRTELGYLRHPTAPEKGQLDMNGFPIPDSWREDDFSSDQAIPLYLAYRQAGMPEADEMKRRIQRAGWKTGNRKLIHPGFYAILNDWRWLECLSVLVQGIIFKLPYRWSDSSKWFEKMDQSSADYLNYVHTAARVPRIFRTEDADTIKLKIRQYFVENANPEPNCEFVLEKYERVIDKYFRPKNRSFFEWFLSKD